MDSAIKLIAWPGWAVVGPLAGLAMLLAAVLAMLLPFPPHSLRGQLQRHADRMDLRAYLGLGTPFESYRTATRRFNDWLDRWFGPPFSSQAFERCLAIAFIYPITIFLITLVINGAVKGQVGVWDFLGFLLALTVGVLAAYFLLGRLVALAQRLWTMIGGDADIAPVLARVALGLLAVLAAFAIAFAIASVISSQAYGAGSVAISVLMAFALAFGLALTFAFAGTLAFVAAVVAIAAASLFFAGEFAFVLLLFFVMIPIANAVADWLSWASSRLLMRRVERMSGRAGVATAIGAVALSAIVALILVGLLAVLLANGVEAMSATLTALGHRGVVWRPLLELAVKSPWTEAFFITGMLLTPLAPVFAHLVMGAAGVFARFTPGARARAAIITEHPEATMEEDEIARISATVRLSRLWYLPAALNVLALFALVAMAAYFSGLNVSRFLGDLALCSTSWSHGVCRWR